MYISFISVAADLRYNLPKILMVLGGLLIIIGVIDFFLLFGSVLSLEFNYYAAGTEAKIQSLVDKNSQVAPKPLLPIDTNFGIVIPKIGANARIIANVNPFDPAEYQQKLALGVAHAWDSSLPGFGGNIFLFSHSGADFREASRYNAVFYLIDKLQSGDEIDLYYRGKKYIYLVKEKKIVDPERVEYIPAKLTSLRETVTLMTCWPAGTTFKRLLVIAEAGAGE